MNSNQVENEVVISKDYLDSLLTRIKERKEEYDKIVDRVAWLDALEAAGVDSWEGIDTAIEIFNGFQEE